MKFVFKNLIFLSLIRLLFVACSQDGKQVMKEATKEAKETSNKQTEKEEVKEEIKITAEEGTPDWTFQHLVKAVEENDIDQFMKFQREKNTIFFKEQQRWIEEAIFKKEQGFTISVSFSNFHEKSDTAADVTFTVKMKHPEGVEEFNNKVIYECILENGLWILNDVPFKTITSDSKLVTIYYREGEDTLAEKTLKDAVDLVQFYSDQFQWVPNPISIKIYSSNEEASATVPWTILGGWNEIGESLKITSQQEHDVFRLLTHELTHKLLGDLTNDNAILFLQEGFATYLENKVQRDQTGKLIFDQSIVDQKSKKAIDILNSVLTIKELSEMDYSSDTLPLYRDGSLISNYLILTYGLDTYLQMFEYLSQFEYVNQRMEHKLDIITPRSIEALEKVYGPIDQLSKNYQDYYLK